MDAHESGVPGPGTPPQLPVGGGSCDKDQEEESERVGDRGLERRDERSCELCHNSSDIFKIYLWILERRRGGDR